MIQQTALMLVAGLIFLFSFTQDHEEHLIVSTGLAVLLLAFFTLMPGLLLYYLGKRGLRQLSTDQARQIVQLQNSRRQTLFFGIVVLIGFVFEVYFLQLPLLVNKSFAFLRLENTRTLIGIIPLVIGILLTRLATYELDRQVRNTSWTRRRFLSLHVKMMVFPLLPFISYLAFGDLISHSPLSVRIFFVVHPYFYWMIMFAIILFMYTEAPYFISKIWMTRPLPDGEIRSRIESLAKRENIKYKDVLIWNMSGGKIANAGMAGLLSFSRYVFLTDSLLENFTLDEIETVVAHEFGHIKYRHTLAYLVFSLGYLVFYIFLYLRFLPVIEKVQFNTLYIALLSAIGTLFAFYIYFVVFFRFLSRKFERQADLYAVESTGKPEIFKSALLRLCAVNYIPRRVPLFTELIRSHPSVARRLQFVDKTVQGDSEALKYRQPVFRIGRASVLVLIMLSLLVLFSRETLFPPGEMYYEMGRQYAIEGMIDEAITKFMDAARANPESGKAHYALGILYAEKGIMEKAAKEFERSLMLNPQNIAAREKLQQIRSKQATDPGPAQPR